MDYTDDVTSVQQECLRDHSDRIREDLVLEVCVEAVFDRRCSRRSRNNRSPCTRACSTRRPTAISCW